MRINGGYSFRMHDSQPALASVIWEAAEEKKTFPLGQVCHLHPPSMYVCYLGHRRRNNNIPPPFQLPIVMRNFLTNIWPNSSTVVDNCDLWEKHKSSTWQQLRKLLLPIWIIWRGKVQDKLFLRLFVISAPQSNPDIKTYLVAILLCVIVAPTENTRSTWEIL